MSNIENTEKGIGFLERVMQLVSKYSIWQFFKGFVILLVTALVIWFISNPTYIFEKYAEWDKEQHQAKLEMRLENNQKINQLLNKNLYKNNIDRIMILELHNGNTGNGGLPFAKCSATFEVLNDGTYPISSQYQDVNLSLMPFATHMFQYNYWCGNTDEIKTIDKGLYHKMKGNGTEHFAASVIEGVDKPIALLIVSFKNIDELHNCEVIKSQVERLSLEVALLLELNKYAK